MNNSRRPEQIAEGVAHIRQKYGSSNPSQQLGAATPKQILSALDGFMECVRYLNTRRSTGAILALDSEAAVQDAIYLMLRPWITDLIPENPTDRIASRYTIKDFVSKSARTVIEAKFIRDAAHGKNVSKELHDDIETYRHHPACRNLIFFLYDPNALIPDHAALQRQIAVERIYDGVPLMCYLLVKP